MSLRRFPDLYQSVKNLAPFEVDSNAEVESDLVPKTTSRGSVDEPVIRTTEAAPAAVNVQLPPEPSGFSFSGL